MIPTPSQKFSNPELCPGRSYLLNVLAAAGKDKNTRQWGQAEGNERGSSGAGSAGGCDIPGLSTGSSQLTNRKGSKWHFYVGI